MTTAQDQRDADVALLRKLCADTHHPTTKSVYKDAAEAIEAAPLVNAAKAKTVTRSTTAKPTPKPRSESE